MGQKEYVAQLEKVINGRIQFICETPKNKRTNPEDDFFGLQIIMPDGKEYRLWFLSDEEGNAPGGFDLVDLTEIKKSSELKP